MGDGFCSDGGAQFPSPLTDPPSNHQQLFVLPISADITPIVAAMMDGSKVMGSLAEATTTLTFRVNFIISLLINFGINFGFEWASLSQWGKIAPEDFSSLYITKWNYTVNSCILMDLLLTMFIIASATTLFGTNGIVQDIKKGTMLPLDTAVTDTWLWKLTPVRVMHLGFRSLYMGLWWTILIGLPTLGVLSAILGGGPMDGVSYTWFKAVWAMCVAAPVFVFMFVGCADSRLHQGLAFSQLMDGGAAEAPPLVGQVGRV